MILKSLLMILVSFIVFKGPQYWSALLLIDYPEQTDGVVIISGASSGIGLDAAVFLASKGFHVFAGVRKESDFTTVNDAFKNEVKSIPGGKVIPVIMDVTNDAQVNSAMDQAFKYAKDNKLKLAGIVTNAGYGGDMNSVEYSTIPAYEYTMNVNFYGAVRMTIKAIPELRKSGGRIITISSVAGKSAQALTSVYASSKFALEGFHDSLRREVGKVISVSIIDAACISTRMPTEHMKQQIKQASKVALDPLYKPQHNVATMFQVVCGHNAHDVRVSSTQDIYHALTSRKPHTRYYPGDAAGSSARVVLALDWLLPDRFGDLIGDYTESILKMSFGPLLKSAGAI